MKFTYEKKQRGHHVYIDGRFTGIIYKVFGGFQYSPGKTRKYKGDVFPDLTGCQNSIENDI